MAGYNLPDNISLQDIEENFNLKEEDPHEGIQSIFDLILEIKNTQGTDETVSLMIDVIDLLLDYVPYSVQEDILKEWKQCYFGEK